MWLADAGWTVTSAAACWWCFIAARWVEPAARRAWQLLACGCLSWLIGQLHWDYARLVQGVELPFPNVTHVFYTGFAVFMMLGIRQLPQLKQSMGSGGRQVGSIALVTLCLAVILLLGMVGPALRADLAPLYLGGGLVHTLVVCGAFLVTLHALWSVEWNGRWAAMLMLVVANGMYALSTIIYTHALLMGSYLPTDLVNVGWLAMFGLVACAAHEQVWSSRRSVAATGTDNDADWLWLQSVVPAVVVVIMAIVAVGSAATLTPTVAPWAVAMFILLALVMGIREVWTQRDQQALIDRLWRASERLSCDMPLLSSDEGVAAAISRFRQGAHALRAPASRDSGEVAAEMTAARSTGGSAVDDAPQKLTGDLLNHLELRATRYLQRIQCGELSPAALLDDLLRHYSQLEGVNAQPIRMDLSALIEQALQALPADLQGHRIQVRCDQPQLFLHSRVGELPMRLVLRLLLGIALNRARNAPAAQVDVHCSRDGDHIVLAVGDNGNDVDATQHSRLLLANHALQDVVRSAADLQLALLSRAVRRMAGMVHVTESSGQGIRLVIEVPDLASAPPRHEGSDLQASSWSLA